MKISYMPLWHLLLDKGMSKKDLSKATGISTATIAKMTKDENVNTAIIIRICTALHCKSLDEVMELKDE